MTHCLTHHITHCLTHHITHCLTHRITHPITKLDCMTYQDLSICTEEAKQSSYTISHTVAHMLLFLLSTRSSTLPPTHSFLCNHSYHIVYDILYSNTVNIPTSASPTSPRLSPHSHHHQPPYLSLSTMTDSPRPLVVWCPDL